MLLGGFVAWELRHPEPLMRFGILRTKTVAGANVSGFILGTAIFSMFLMLTLYMQNVLGYSPMKTGVAYLAVAGSAIIWSAVAAQLVTRLGVKPVLVVGMAALAGGLAWFTQVSVDGSYVQDLLPGFLLVGVGIGFAFVPISIAALAGVRMNEMGLASGLINTSQQIGGALGIAALSTIATSRDVRRGRIRHGAGAGRRRRLLGRVPRRADRRRDRHRRLARPDPPRRAGDGDGAGDAAGARARCLTNDPQRAHYRGSRKAPPLRYGTRPSQKRAVASAASSSRPPRRRTTR